MGYLQLQLRNARNDELCSLRISRLVASVSINPPSINNFNDHLNKYNRMLETHHRDGNQSNNFFENLEYAQNIKCARYIIHINRCTITLNFI
jgi:hypothetical protein